MITLCITNIITASKVYKSTLHTINKPPYIYLAPIRTPTSMHRSRGSSGSIVSDYGLDDRAIEVRSPTGAEDFSSSPCDQTGSGAHPASYPMGIGGSFPVGKAGT
jgi:hypothetical protein